MRRQREAERRIYIDITINIRTHCFSEIDIDNTLKVKTEPGADDNKMEVEMKDEIVKEGADDVVKKEGEEEIKTEAEKKEKEEKDKEVEEAVPAGVAAGLDKDGIPVAFETMADDTEDIDDVQESEHFDNRLSVLKLCTGNHYQFDQLRRAKHSSMMVLYHLHNPDAPKFERARSIQQHMEYLQHASQCTSATCPSRTCAKMKEFIKHEQLCQIKAVGGCRLCQRINAFLTLHARSCKLETCVVPKCHEIRNQIRQMAIRQQSMDDRRSAMMNEMYSRGGSSAPSEN
eukprot:GSChrysophyteH2.ASY1.ANO1.1469.1 assembled CDS